MVGCCDLTSIGFEEGHLETDRRTGHLQELQDVIKRLVHDAQNDIGRASGHEPPILLRAMLVGSLALRWWQFLDALPPELELRGGYQASARLISNAAAQW